jgi:RNA polymerase sigma-70 factor (ECF subfamily)
MDDRELAERFRSGDEDAVRIVYRRHSRAVMTVAMSVLRDRQLAAEAVQQTFLKAWRAAATFDPDRELAPWLYSIARRAAIDLYRSEHRPTRADHEEEVDVAVAGHDVDAAWEAWEIRTAIEQLDDDEREVVRLAHYEGLTHSQIAALLDVPLGTIKSRSHRAHRRLARLLQHLMEARR